ncbi:MAG: metallophosphoesterase [Phycisphaerales bacterium]
MSFSRLSIPSLLICLAATVICPATERWRFIVTCDSRSDVLTSVNQAILSEIASEIVRQDVDFLLYPGDLVYGGRIGPERFENQLWTWVRIMKPVYDAGIPVYVCRGNHEVGDMWDAEPGQLPDPNDNYSLRWLDVFGNPERPSQILPDNGPSDARYMSYSVRHKNALIVATDQYGGMEHWLAQQVDQRWVDSQLQSNTKPHVFVFGHEPAFKLLHPDCLDDYPAQRDEFWRGLQAAGTRMYFCGHDHFYNHAQVDEGDGNPDNDVHQIVIATAGAPGYTWLSPYNGDNGPFLVTLVFHAEQYGYILVEIDDLHVTATWMERRTLDYPGLSLYNARHTWEYWVVPRPMVARPNGGERIPAGEPYVVTWRTTEGADIQRVAVEYSLDRGVAWTTAGETDNTGQYVWLAPAVRSDECLVRVTDALNPAATDTSDKPFAIVNPSAKLAADLNDDGCVDFADLAILASQWLTSAEKNSIRAD